MLVIVLVEGRERAGQPLLMATMHFAVVSPQWSAASAAMTIAVAQTTTTII